MLNTHRCCNPGFRSSRLSQAIQGILLASALTASVAAHGEEIGNRKSYHISGGSLGHALSQFARDAGILFTGESTLTDGKISKGLDGEYTVEEGFRKLLAGSGLTYTITSDNAVAIKIADLGSDAAPTLPAVKVIGTKVGYDSTDPYTRDYSVPSSNAASKTEMALMETPVNIQIIPRTVMDDQQDIDITDAVTKNVSGVQRNMAYGDLYENFNIRGFSTNYSTYRNGLRRYTNYSDPVNLEQVEVIKGPAAVLYGQIQPGGMVNVVTKKALDKPYYSLQQQFGSYDQYRTTAAATGPLDDAKTLKYRFDASYQDLGSFKKYVGDERVFLAPKLSWTPNDQFEANAELEYKYEQRVDDNGIPQIGNRPAPVAFDTFLGDMNKGPKMNSVLTALDWSYKFDQNWQIKNRFMHEDWNIDYFDIMPNGMRNASQMNRFAVTGLADHETYGTNLDLTGNFRVLGSKHEVLIGGDFSRRTRKAGNNRYSCCNGSTAVAPIDIFNPTYDTVSLDRIYASPFDYAVRQKEEWFGVYFQDHITLWDKLHILGGGRYDWATFGQGADPATGSYSVAALNYRSYDNEKFSPRVGLLYQPMTWLSVYGNFTESLGSANLGAVYGNQQVQPEIGEQFEAGFKTEFFDQRLSSTVSFYHLTKDNVRVNDAAHRGFFIAAGQARSQGIEADLKGRITEDLDLVLTYAYTDVRVTKNGANTNNILGNRLANVPEHQASLWSTYQITPHFKAGIGGTVVSEREGNSNNTFQLPGYARMDLMAAYVQPLGKTRLTSQLNINNVLDKAYYAGTDGFSNTVTANPITVMGSLKLEY